MTIKSGDAMPPGSMKVMTDDGPVDLTTDELFSGKKVVLFSVPGAFTSTCSRFHLPGFIDHADEMKKKGVDTIACMAVNDADVMSAWGKDRGTGDHVVMLADGNADYTRALGLEWDLGMVGMGVRGRRFAMIVDDGVATHVAVEEPGKFEVSKAESILSVL